MKLKENLVGLRFTRLVVNEFAYKDDHSNNYWKCVCDCGAEITVAQSSLRRTLTQSCGCLQKERARESNSTHRMSNTSEYRIWCGIIQRTSNVKEVLYEYYGGRGIKVCERWLRSFENFYEDMGPRPGPEYSIERINNERNYCPENCKWSTDVEQNRNRRSNVMITFEDKTMCMTDWAEEKYINLSTLRDRLSRGWSIEKALNTPARFIQN